MKFFVYIKRKLKKSPQARSKYIRYKEIARKIVHDRVQHFNQFYKFKIGRISIKDQRTRWGSCSKVGNLNFNYRLALLPLELVDYIIVHELCHLKEFNHSKNFWDQVKLTIPNYIEIRKRLKSLKMP